jgi:protein ImuB
VFSPSWSDEHCSAVLEQERVLAVSAPAYAAGIRPGMRRGGALMLAPQLRLHERAPEREAEALQAVALAMLQYTPLVTAAEEAALMLDIGASLRLFGGIRALCRLVVASMDTLGFSLRLACAPTARGAWLLAQAGAGRTLTMEAMARRLDRLPAGFLPPARPYLDWFDGIACRTLGEIRRLPRPGLQRRCGRTLLDMLDAAHGRKPELFVWIQAPASFRARIELFDRVEQADALLAGACRLLQQMTGWLSARQLAVERIVLLLEHERGRVARAPTVVELVLAEPVWRDDHLVRLLKERLGRLVLDAPVIGLCLEAPQVQPMLAPSASLFPEPGGAPEERRLFELLAARLGPGNVLQAAPLADYRPELANAWVPLQQRRAPAAQMPPDGRSPPRPAWLLATPLALPMREHRPLYGSPLTMVSAPERIEAGWWSQALSRDYFIAQGDDQAYYWVYRERIAAGGQGREGRGEPAEPRWYLHGLFG